MSGRGAIAGAALAPRRQRALAGALGAAGAVGAAYLSFDARIRSMQRFGQVSTGVVEDAIMLAATLAIVGGAAPAKDEAQPSATTA